MADGNFEAALLTSTITQASVREVIKHKITPDFFEGARERSAFVWLMDWYRNPKYADTPSWEIFMDTWPDFEPEESSDSVAALCDKVRERKLFSDLAASLQQVALVGQGDPHAGLSEFRKHAAKLSATHTVDSSVTLADHISTIRAEYIRMATMEPGEQKLKGRPYPWPALNEATLGCQDGQLIVIYGRPKSYKTWTALRAVVEFALNGARPLIYSQELSDLEMARRYVALLSRVDYTAFQKGLLDEQTSHDFLEDLEAFVEQSTVTFDYLSCSPAEVGIQIGAKIDETGSNVVLIDGAHTLGRGDWKELSVLTQELKKTAKMKNVPIIVTTHANRKKTEGGGTGDDMAHSDSFYQDCDVALRVKLSLENRRSREAMIETAAIREGAPCAFIVNTLLASNMEQKRVVQMTENDEGGEGAGDGAADARE